MRTFICKTHEDDGKSAHRIKAMNSRRVLPKLEAKLGKKVTGHQVLGDYIWYSTRK